VDYQRRRCRAKNKRGKKKKKKSERPSVLISEGGAREDFGYSQGPQTLP
jgi:hypothetical protein